MLCFFGGLGFTSHRSGSLYEEGIIIIIIITQSWCFALLCFALRHGGRLAWYYTLSVCPRYDAFDDLAMFCLVVVVLVYIAMDLLIAADVSSRVFPIFPVFRLTPPFLLEGIAESHRDLCGQ